MEQIFSRVLFSFTFFFSFCFFLCIFFKCNRLQKKEKTLKKKRGTEVTELIHFFLGGGGGEGDGRVCF